MDGRCKQMSDVYIINSSKITFSKDKVGSGNFADVYKGVASLCLSFRLWLINVAI